MSENTRSNFMTGTLFQVGARKVSLANLFEILSLFTLIFLVLYVNTQQSYFNWSRSEWNTFFIVAVSPGVIAIFLFMFLVGTNDYKVRLMFHQFTLAIIIVIFAFLISGVLKSTNFNYQEFIIPMALILIFGFSVFLSLLNEVEAYYTEFDTAFGNFLQGKFSYQITNTRVLNDSVFGSLGERVNHVLMMTNDLITNLNSTSTITMTSEGLSSTAEDMNASAEEVASTSQSMSDVANEQAKRVQEILNELDNVKANVQRIVGTIQENSGEVSKIAIQTNILALNAGIEASRAGDYGRGFAVVADNVRRLSDESKVASENIQKVSQSVSDELTKAFEEIYQKVEEIAALSEETAASAEEVASVAEEMTSSMEEMTASSQMLAEQANKARGFIEETGLEMLLEK